jgi:hypothetical protein
MGSFRGSRGLFLWRRLVGRGRRWLSRRCGRWLVGRCRGKLLDWCCGSCLGWQWGHLTGGLLRDTGIADRRGWEGGRCDGRFRSRRGDGSLAMRAGARGWRQFFRDADLSPAMVAVEFSEICRKGRIGHGGAFPKKYLGEMNQTVKLRPALGRNQAPPGSGRSVPECQWRSAPSQAACSRAWHGR